MRASDVTGALFFIPLQSFTLTSAGFQWILFIACGMILKVTHQEGPLQIAIFFELVRICMWSPCFSNPIQFAMFLSSTLQVYKEHLDTFWLQFI